MRVVLAMAGCSVHLIVEITIFLTLFLMLCDTYLFQVGLLGVLFAHFKAAFLLQPVYLLFTLFLDGYRIVRAAAADTVMTGAAASKAQSRCCSAYLWLLACLSVRVCLDGAGRLVGCSELPDGPDPPAVGPLPAGRLPGHVHPAQTR